MLVNFISALGRNAINFGRALGRAGLLLFGAFGWQTASTQAFPAFLLNNYTFSVCNRY